MPDAARIHPLLSDPGGGLSSAIVLAGAIYGQVVANVGDRYLNDIFRATVGLVQTELADQPIERWNAELEPSACPLPIRSKVEPLDTYRLSDSKPRSD